MTKLARALAVALTLMVASATLAVPAAAAAAAPGSRSLVGPVPAEVNDFTFRDMHADYTIGRADDGSSTLKVVETFTAVFPQGDQNRGMRRVIPDTYNGQPLEPELISITDGDGNRRPSETDHDDGEFSMTSRASDYVHGAQTYVFTYTLKHVTWTFGDTNADEFYWDINGVDWQQPFGSVSATLHVPGELASALTGDASCYAGRQGDTTTCPITAQREPDGSATVTTSVSNVAPFNTVTIAVGFSKGTFVPFDSSYFGSPGGWLQMLAVLAALTAVALAIVTRVRVLRDPPGRGTIIPEYEPPRELDAMQAAVLLGRPTKAIAAGVLDEAIRGNIRLFEGERKKFSGTAFHAEFVQRYNTSENGQRLLSGMFSDNAVAGEGFAFKGTNAAFAKASQEILSRINDELVENGVRQKIAGRTKALPIVIASIAAPLAILLGIIALSTHTSPALPGLGLFVGIAAFITVLTLLSRKPLTQHGVALRDHLLGLKMFIEWGEADRIRTLQSPAGAERAPSIDTNDSRQMLKLYERLLPYAVIFGQEKQWSAQLANYYDAQGAPYWYSGTTAFNAAAFSAGIGSLSAAATSSSSTSGGSSGGGSAGGGGGGGGGGGV